MDSDILECGRGASNKEKLLLETMKVRLLDLCKV